MRILRSTQVLLAAAGVVVLVSGAATSVGRTTATLGNGAARTPPMGWNSWMLYGCTRAMNQANIEAQADALVRTGLAARGYVYVNLDDCWEARTRSSTGALRADPRRFPSGMAALGRYLHARGLKFGIYSSPGATTCSGRPGSLGHEQQDADTFASWGVDYLKYDWCRARGTPDTAWPTMTRALARTGRSIIFMANPRGNRHGTAYAPLANLWRTAQDPCPQWSHCPGYRTPVTRVLAEDGAPNLAGHAGPGAWNDPSHLMIGTTTAAGHGHYTGLSTVEGQSQIAMFAVLAAPLVLSNDLTAMSPATLSTVRDRAVIAVDQDAAGRQGTLVQCAGGRQVWRRQLTHGIAVALLNLGGAPATITASRATLGLPAAGRHQVHRLLSGTRFALGAQLRLSVPSHGVAIVTIT